MLRICWGGILRGTVVEASSDFVYLSEIWISCLDHVLKGNGCLDVVWLDLVYLI